MKEGPYDFIKKPIDPDELIVKVKKAVEQFHLELEREYLKKEIDAVGSFNMPSSFQRIRS